MNKSVSNLFRITTALSLLLGVPLLVKTNKEAQSVEGYSASSLPTTIDLNDTTEANIRSYYSSLNNKTQSERQGTNLLKNLKTILKNGQKYYSYENGTSIWQMYEITDRDWAKSPASSTTYGTYNSSTNKITNYTYGTSKSSSKNNPYIHALYINRDVTNQTTAWDDHNQDQWGINREHVWPKAEGFDSDGAGGARGDPMHLMAGNGYANNIHSNYYYGYVKTSSSYTDCGSKYSNQSGNLRGTSKTLNSGTVFEPQDSDKGDIARAIFYMVARYNYLSGSDSDGIDTNNPNLTLTQNISDWSSSGYTSSTSTQGKLGVLTDLLAWHHADPVDEYEIHRNNLLYTNFTNNRNPFIDFPEWADFIWGTATYNGTTYQSYSSTPTGYATPSTDTINGYNSGGGSTPVAVTGVSLNKNSTTITVGDSEVLTATVSPNDATNQTVSWTSSNTNVATVSSSGRVAGVVEGNSTITVTTSDGGFTATCTVTVSASSGGGGSSDPETDIMIAKGFGGYTTSSYSAAGTDYTGKANIENNSDATYAMQVFNGATGQVRGNQSGSGNFSCRNTTTYSGYYVSEISLTIDNGGTLDGSDSDRSVVWFGSSAYANPTTAPSTGTKVSASPSSSGQSTLTWSNTNTSYNYFILYNLKAANAPKSKDEDTPLKVTWSPISASSKTLDSISLDTDDAQTIFYLNDEFNHDEIVVTAHYDDGSSDIVVPTSVSTPDLSSVGEKDVTVTYTEGGVSKTATYQISVKHPGSTETSQMIVSKETSPYYSEGAIHLEGNETVGTANCDAFTVVQTKTGGTKNITYVEDEIRVLAYHNFMITPKDGYVLTSIVCYANSVYYASNIGYGSGNLTNCTKSTASNTIVTLTPTDGSLTTGFYNTNESRINYIIVNFEEVHLTWNSPSIDVYSGSTLTAENVNSWGVSDGTTTYTSSDLTVKLGGETISIPHTWSASDDGKALKAYHNGLSTEDSTAVRVTQSVNNITASISDSYNYIFESKQYESAGTVALGGHSWTMAGTGNGFWGYDSTKGQQFGSGANPYSTLSLSCSDFIGTITSIDVYTSGASSINATVKVTVNGIDYGSATSITSTNAEYQFEKGGESGTIVILWNQTSSKAIYIKQIVVRSSINGNIANNTTYIDAQRAAVKFANAFNAAMDDTSCCTENLESAWSTCTAAYNAFKAEIALFETDAEEEYAKNLIKCATAQYSNDSGEACIERMMKTYEICVLQHGQTAFMSELVTLSSRPVNPILSIPTNKKGVAIIVIASILSVSVIGGYFFLKSRRKEDF